jgi:hemolysin activation/secretion protein
MRQPSRLTQVFCLFIGLTVSFSISAASGHKKEARQKVSRQRGRAIKARVRLRIEPATGPALLVGDHDAVLEKMLTKMQHAKSPATLIKYLKLAQDLPGVAFRPVAVKDRRDGKIRIAYRTSVKRFSANWFVRNGGNDPKVGRFPINLGASVYNLFGGDRLSVSGNTTEEFGPSWGVGANYQKVLTAEGLRLRAGYTYSAYTQPWEDGITQLYKTHGHGYSLSLSQPLIVGAARRLDVFLVANYATGYPKGLSQNRHIWPNDILTEVQSPTLKAGVVYRQDNRYGRFLGDVSLTKGMDLLGLKTRYTWTGRPDFGRAPPVDPETHFLTMNADFNQQIVFTREWQLGLSYRFQLSNRTLPLQGAQKFYFGDGAYASQGYAGDVGQAGKVGVNYAPAALEQALQLPVKFELYYAAGSTRNYGEELPYVVREPQTVGLRVSFSVPKASLNGFVDVAEPFSEDLSSSQSRQTVVHFGIGQSF